jgi:hydrogenase-4 component F
MILCSAGLLIGLVGLLVLFCASGISVPFLISALSAKGLLWNALILKIAFIFLFIGFGTKVGFVPLHTWLPDAHGETPAPISGMLSGVLLSVAFIALLRFKGIVDHGLGGSEWTNRLFLIFGLTSVIYAAFLLLRQQNIKRMLAHSSIEHMGIAAFGVALGPVGVAAALLHLVGHALLKSLLFFASGELYMRAKSPLISDMRGIMAREKRTTTLFFFGLLALLAAPPSALFLSELAIVSVGVAKHATLLPSAVLLAAILIASFAMMKHATQFLDARQHADSPAVHVGIERKEVSEISEKWNLTHVAMLALLLLLIGLSVFAATLSGQQFFFTLAQLITHSA